MLEGSDTVVEEIELCKAFYEVYDGAVYMHQGRTYLCTKLDLSSLTAFVRPVRLKYFTTLIDLTDVHVMGGNVAYFPAPQLPTPSAFTPHQPPPQTPKVPQSPQSHPNTLSAPVPTSDVATAKIHHHSSSPPTPQAEPSHTDVPLTSDPPGTRNSDVMSLHRTSPSSPYAPSHPPPAETQAPQTLAP